MSTQLAESKLKRTIEWIFQHSKHRSESDTNDSSEHTSNSTQLSSTTVQSINSSHDKEYPHDIIPSPSSSSESDFSKFFRISSLNIKSSNLQDFITNSMDLITRNSKSRTMITFGGLSLKEPFNEQHGSATFFYDGNLNSWNYYKCLPRQTCFHTSTIFNNAVYIIGGFKLNNDVKVWKPTDECLHLSQSGKWNNGLKLQEERACHAACVFSGQLYIIGGIDKNGKILNTVEVYNGQEWNLGAALPIPLSGASAVGVRCGTTGTTHLWILGGITLLNTTSHQPVLSEKVFCLDTDKEWYPLMNLRFPVAYATVLIYPRPSLNDDEVWLCGGITYSKCAVTDITDVSTTSVSSTTTQEVLVEFDDVTANLRMLSWSAANFKRWKIRHEFSSLQHVICGVVSGNVMHVIGYEYDNDKKLNEINCFHNCFTPTINGILTVEKSPFPYPNIGMSAILLPQNWLTGLTTPATNKERKTKNYCQESPQHDRISISSIESMPESIIQDVQKTHKEKRKFNPPLDPNLGKPDDWLDNKGRKLSGSCSSNFYAISLCSIKRHIKPRCMLLFGGVDLSQNNNFAVSSRIICCHPDSQQWSRVDCEMPTGRSYHTAVKISTSKIIIIGGIDQETEMPTQVIQECNLCMGIWNRKADLPEGRAHHSCVEIAGGAYVIGGIDKNAKLLTSIMMYKAANDKWELVMSLPVALAGCAAALWQESVWILGGYKTNGAPSNAVYVLNIKDNALTKGTYLPFGIAFASVVATENALYLIGGVRLVHGNVISNQKLRLESLSSIYCLEKGAKLWTSCGAITLNRHAIATTLVGPESCLLLGGMSTLALTSVATCEIVNLKTGKCRRIDDLPYGLTGATALSWQ